MSKIIKEWRQKELLAEISGRVAQGMEAACQFAADQARARVLVRTGLTRRDIAYEVDARGNLIEGRIGIPKGHRHAWYWIFQELGTRHLPAHPALRPAVFANAREIVRLIVGA